MVFVIIIVALIAFGLWIAFGKSDGYSATPTPAPTPEPGPVGPIDNDGPLVHPVLNLDRPIDAPMPEVAKPKRARKPKAAATTATETKTASKAKAPAKPRKKKGE